MKRVICFLAILSLLFGCKKEGGKLLCTMTYNISNNKNVGYNSKASTDISSNQYSQFGDYITSITPSRFIGKFLHLQLSNWHENQDPGEGLNIDLFDNNSDITDPQRLADFSNNRTVSFTPKEINVPNNTELIYFIAVCLYLYQEFELPEQYENFNGGQLQFLTFGGGFSNNFDREFIGSEKIGCFVKSSHVDLMAPIFDPNWTGFTGTYPVTGHCYVFGNTNSNIIFKSNSDVPTNDNPLGQGNIYIVRSNKYNPITLSSIPDGETKTIKGTMSFNTTDLIQIYAGKDNIPYNKDDYFVYAPNFWERISVSLESY